MMSPVRSSTAGIARVRDPGGQRQHVAQRRDVAADGRHGVGRVEAIGGRRALLARPLRAERSVAVQVEVGEPRAGQRPLVLVAPAAAVHEPARARAPARAAAHHEDPQRRLGVEAIVHAAQPAVVPAQVQLVEARQRRSLAELHVAGVGQLHRPRAVRPRAHQGAHRPPAVGPEPDEVLERRARVRVVPAAHEEDGHLGEAIPVPRRIDARVLPVVVVVGAREDLERPLLVGRHQGELGLAGAGWASARASPRTAGRRG